MTGLDRDPQEAGQAWTRGQLPSRDYFATVRREAVYGRRPTRLWQRITRWIKQVGKREAP